MLLKQGAPLSILCPEAKMVLPVTKMEATVQQHPGQIRHAYQLSLTYTVCVSLQKNLRIWQHCAAFLSKAYFLSLPPKTWSLPYPLLQACITHLSNCMAPAPLSLSLLLLDNKRKLANYFWFLNDCVQKEDESTSWHHFLFILLKPNAEQAVSLSLMSVWSHLNTFPIF